MEHDTITLLLGITFGFAVVGIIIGFTLLVGRAQTASTLVIAPPNASATYNNEEHWTAVKDKDGRVRDITVTRHATQG